MQAAVNDAKLPLLYGRINAILMVYHSLEELSAEQYTAIADRCIMQIEYHCHTLCVWLLPRGRQRMDITYDYYRIFYYAATQGSFSGAAAVLGSNQPNITKYMNNLEAQLRCKLFVRTHRGVILTPEGEKLLAHVSVAYEHLREAERELESEKALQSGCVTVAASETALHGVLLSALRSFHDKCPAIRLCVTNHTTPQALRALENGAADFAVVTTPTDASARFSQTTLRVFQEQLIAAKEEQKRYPKPLSPQEILALPLVGLGRETQTYAFYTRYFNRFGLAWKPDTEASTADQLLPMIENGLGIGFVPDFLAEKALREGTVIVLSMTCEQPSREIVLVEESGRPLSIAAERLRRLLTGEERARGGDVG